MCHDWPGAREPHAPGPIADANPAIQPLIKNFNEEGIILGTEEVPDVEKQTQVDTPAGPGVDQMADRAVSKGLQPDFK